MTKKYCFDTSGISNPLQSMPDDIHTSMWDKFNAIIAQGNIAVTTEIYEEMEHIGGIVGDCIKQNKKLMVCEVNDSSWDWPSYVRCVNQMQTTHQRYISEYNGNTAKTICLNDISIIALSKALNLPLISMEAFLGPSSTKARIPNVCQAESVEHLSFNDFLRRERIRI